MSLSKAMESKLNEQICEELESAFLYLAMAADFEDKDMSGAAAWMRSQYHEELEHAMKFFNWIVEREGTPVVPALKQPQKSWPSLLAAFEAAHKHEKHISSCIDGLVKAARDEADNATESFLQWFVKEQVEEESAVLTIVKRLRLVGETGNGLYMLDRELGMRAQG